MKAMKESLLRGQAEMSAYTSKREDEEEKVMAPRTEAWWRIAMERPEGDFVYAVHPWKLSQMGGVVLERTGEFLNFYVDLKEGPIRANLSLLQLNDEVIRSIGPVMLVKRVVDSPPLPLEWGTVGEVKEACHLVLHETMGKFDLDLKYLVPRIEGILSRSGKSPWPSQRSQITNYLQSQQFAQAIVAFQSNRIDVAPTLSLAKAHLEEARDTVWFDNSWPGYLLYLLSYGLLALVATTVVLVEIGMPPLASLLVLMAVPKCHGSRRNHRFLVSQSYLMLSSVVVSLMLPEVFLVVYLVVGTLLVWDKCQYKVLPTVNFLSFTDLFFYKRCSLGIKLPEIFASVKLSQPPTSCQCQENKRVNSWGFVFSHIPFVIPLNCEHNAYNGLRIRFVFDRTFDPAALGRVIKTGFALLNREYWIPYIGWNEWVSHLPSRRKVIMREAQPSVTRSSAESSIFVKCEAYLGKLSTFKPRIIWCRTPEYQAFVGPMFYSIGKAVANMFPFESNLSYDSGFTAEQLGEKAVRAAGKRYLIEVDVSNWDGSLLGHWYQLELALVRKFAPWAIFVVLKKHWSKMVGRFSKSGQSVSVETRHGRRSGDMWTSFMNSFINICIVYTLTNGDCEVVAKGDDNFFGTNKDLTQEQIVDFYAKLGMTAKVKFRSVDNLGYCSGRFWKTAYGYKWGVAPFRVLSKLFLNINNRPERERLGLMRGVCISMRPVANHVPFIGTLFNNLDKQLSHVKARYTDEYQYKNTSDLVTPLDDGAIRQAMTLYSISYDEYCLIDHFMATVQLSQLPMVITDSLLNRVAAVDVDVDEVPSEWWQGQAVEKTEIPHKPWNFDSRVVLNVVVAPLLEETLRRFWWFTPLIALVEGMMVNPLNLVLHLLLSKLPFGFRLLLHTGFNFYVSRQSRDTGLDNLCFFKIFPPKRRKDNPKPKSPKETLLSEAHYYRLVLALEGLQLLQWACLLLWGPALVPGLLRTYPRLLAQVTIALIATHWSLVLVLLFSQMASVQSSLVTENSSGTLRVRSDLIVLPFGLTREMVLRFLGWQVLLKTILNGSLMGYYLALSRAQLQP